MSQHRKQAKQKAARDRLEKRSRKKIADGQSAERSKQRSEYPLEAVIDILESKGYDLSTVPLPAYTRAGIREIDRRCVEEYGIPSLILMENAARSVADFLMEDESPYAKALDVEDDDPALALICTGPGNNGGDGLALARHLHNAGLKVRVLAAFDPEHVRTKMSDEARTNLEICTRMAIPVEYVSHSDAADDLAMTEKLDHLFADCKVVVDALFGVGLTRPIEGVAARIIERINLERDRKRVLVVAVDVPSGLDCDTGIPLGAWCIRADMTVTLVGTKRGYYAKSADEYLGDLRVGDIGAPRQLEIELILPVAASSLKGGELIDLPYSVASSRMNQEATATSSPVMTPK